MKKINPLLLDHQIESNDATDPIDALVPPPGPWWRRLIIGVLIVGSIGIGSFLWGLGYIRPEPDCCGDGSGSAIMSLSVDGDAVTTTAYFYNSSGRTFAVSSASAELPGAEVLDVAMLDPDNDVFPTDNVVPFPTKVGSHDSAQFLITFRPASCDDELGGTAPWGKITLDLDIADSWLPSIRRSYELAVLEQPDDLSVLPPAWVEDVPHTPLAAACALLAG